MRFLYFILYFILRYTLRLYFKNVVILNKPKRFGRTIYVSNHAAAFMDPLVVAAFNRAILYFMTRSDVFNAFTKPFFWMAHMLPIYRQQDGVNTKEKNKEVFRKCTETLLRKRNLLIFGEGFTDDVFIRRLKPLKKGAVRIGFTALESCNWEKDIYLAAVGCNYGDPGKYGSELLISTSEKIHLNTYRKEYTENPTRIINELTLKIEGMLKEQLTHVEDVKRAFLHEKIMSLLQKGMADSASNGNESLEKRWHYSKRLADFLNDPDLDVKEMEASISGYSSKLKQNKCSDVDLVHAYRIPVSFLSYVLQIVLLPFSLIGFVHCGVVFLLIKRFVESKLKRPVFWGSSKLMMMIIIGGILNLSVFFILPCYIGWYLTVLYFLLIPVFGHIFHSSLRFWKDAFRRSNIRRRNIDELLKERDELILKIRTFVEPVKDI